MTKKLFYSKCVPGGNTTILVYNNIPRDQQPALANLIMKAHPDCEQVGYIEPTDNPKALCRLQMMGGEFCGNASRSLVWVATEFLSKNGWNVPLNLVKAGIFNPGAAEYAPACEMGSVPDNRRMSVPIEVSGYDGVLTAFVQVNTATHVIDGVRVPMPIRDEMAAIESRVIATLSPIDLKLSKSFPISIVHLDGISHVIIDNNESDLPSDRENRMAYARAILLQVGLMNQEAAGVLFCDFNDESIEMDPYVYVRETDTLIPETACGSGTIAIVQQLAGELKETVRRNIIQPSGSVIEGTVNIVDNSFTGAWVSGKVEITEEGEMDIEMPNRINYDFRLVQLKTAAEFEEYRNQLVSIYKRIFADAPYYELFTDDEAASELLKTIESEDGLLFIALDGDTVAGFGGGLPLNNYPAIVDVVADHVNADTTFYMSELGVDYPYRGTGLSHLLVDVRLPRIADKYTDVIVRTSVENNPTQHLYRNCRKFIELEGVRMDVLNRKHRPGIDTPVEEIDERLFLVLDRETASQNVISTV